MIQINAFEIYYNGIYNQSSICNYSNSQKKKSKIKSLFYLQFELICDISEKSSLKKYVSQMVK